jgi:hypothetical protein
MRTLSLAVLALSACAATPPPVDQLAAARAQVGQAQGAQADAPLELAHAQTKLARAEEAMQHGEFLEARRLAEQAEVDAILADALADNARASRNVAELERSIDQLRKEQQ